MVVVPAVIVAGMNHPQMPGQLMNHGREIFSEVRMPGIQANANFTRVQGAQNPQKVPRPAGKEMWKHILQHKTDAQPPAVKKRLV